MKSKTSLFLITIVVLVQLAYQQTENGKFPPTIINQPSTDDIYFDVGKVVNNSFFLPCEAKGEPEPTYRWTKNNEELTNPYRSTDVGDLYFSELKEQDEGVYRCYAQNHWGIATSNEVKLRKASFDHFGSSRVNQISTSEGAVLKLSCSYPSGWPNSERVWYREYSNDTRAPIEDSERITVDPEGNLLFANVTTEDDDSDVLYTCGIVTVYAVPPNYEAREDSGDSFSIEVQPSSTPASQNRREPLLQYGSPENLNATKGDVAKIYCIFGGTPTPRVTWRKNGYPIFPTERFIFDNHGRHIEIRDVDQNDAGYYQCIADNGVGVSQIHAVRLFVYAKPYFSLPPHSIAIAEGRTAQFSCIAFGVPEPTVEWWHNGKPLTLETPNSKFVVERYRIMIVNATEADSGNFGCKATNSIGTVYEDVSLNVVRVQ